MPIRPTAAKTPPRTKAGSRPKAQAARTKSSPPQASAVPSIEIDERRTLALVMELMAIRGKSGEEGKVAEYVTRKLRAAGGAGRGNRQRQRPQTDAAERRSWQFDLQAAGHAARAAAAADGPHGYGADLRRLATGAEERLRAFGRQVDRPGGRRPRRRGSHSKCGPDDSGAQAAAPAADIPVGRAGGSGAVRRAACANQATGRTPVGLQLGRRTGRQADTRRNGGATDWRFISKGWPAMPAALRKRA